MKSKTFIGIGIFMILLVVMVPISFGVSFDSENPHMTVTMDKLHELDVSFKRIPMDAASDTIGNPMELEEDDEIILTIIKYEEISGEETFQQFIDYNYGEEGIKVKLVPGKYSINGQLLVNRNITIPGRKDTYCKGIAQQDFEQTSSTFATGAAGVVVGAAVGTAISAAIGAGSVAAAGPALVGVFSSGAGFMAALGPIGLVALGLLAVFAVVTSLLDCTGTEESVEIPEISMNPAMLGGVMGNITLNQDIYSKSEITFYVFSTDPPLAIEGLNILGMIEDLGIIHPDLIQPDLS